MRDQVHRILNEYLTAQLGRAIVLPEVAELERQRQAFLAQFSPERLMTLSAQELLYLLPYNTRAAEPMDYWLEFKSDETFNTLLFGGIGGGSAAKFGSWQQKSTGAWRGAVARTNTYDNISEAEALRIIETRRADMINAAHAISPLDDTPAEAIDPDSFQQLIEQAAPHWHAHGWFHKYLHLNFPRRASATWAKRSP